MSVGVITSSIMLFMGGLFDGDGHGGDGNGGGHDDGGGHGHGEVHVNFFSPLYLSILMISVGATGIISLHGFHMEQRLSLVFAFATSVIIAYLVSYGYISFFAKAQGTSIIKTNELVGLQAEVISPILPGTPGQIAYVIQSGRQTRIAKVEVKEEIPRGAIVEITKIIGDIAIVKLAK